MTISLQLRPSEAADPAFVRALALEEAGLSDNGVYVVTVIRRAIDARPKMPRVVVHVEISTEPHPVPKPLSELRQANPEKRVVIVGAGPAGYFAALELLKYGITPVVVDRGKNVRDRRRDLRVLQQEGIVNPHSNYCFGEGGAGTYSDGKLHTRSDKRGNVRNVLELLVAHGASSNILVESHPHIGSNKLWMVVQRLRETIIEYGGQVHFNSYVTKFIASKTNPNRIIGVYIENGQEIMGDAVILATGHSARDIYKLCLQSGIAIQEKPYALGVRIEHPQEFIDTVQYHHSPRDPFLPPASYSLVCQVGNRGVFTFCMCPGGIIVPASTAPGEIVVNGMSMSKRDSRFANSGLVVEVSGGLSLQCETEQKAFAMVSGSTQKAPAQRVADFVNRKRSTSLPDTSYIPGIESVDLHKVLPSDVSIRIAEAIVQFNTRMRGYLTNDAIVVATESRTSSPVRILRDSKTLESVTMAGLYPCGEGAGYAGGIMSAALDGQRVARAIAKTM